MNNSHELAIEVIGLPLVFKTPIADLMVFTNSWIVQTKNNFKQVIFGKLMFFKKNSYSLTFPGPKGAF